ncbi:hypothetical protein AMTR_s00050p00204320 [Amborella trichopoda]|uniref:Uncharacterized protein n=1 Tax=Amborella trichopoda TaxID=13333 RepID=W1PZB1_AMBTC|nr:hypothetical protein AMTR_s00050p00204320 [Amborella trichopoda]
MLTDSDQNECISNGMEDDLAILTADHEGAINIEPQEGMLFESEFAVRIFDNDYVRQKGFDIRCYGKHISKDDECKQSYRVKNMKVVRDHAQLQGWVASQ